MRKRIFIAALMLLVAAAAVGCNGQRIVSHDYKTQKEAAILQNHTGSFSRTVEVKDALQPVFWVSISPEKGRIHIRLTDEKGSEYLSLNESATLPEDGRITVTPPAGQKSYTLDITTVAYSGNYEITWEFEEAMEE